MKKNVIASILGVAGLVGLAASSYGQGSVIFNTYNSTGYYPVTYSAAAQTALSVGLGAGPNVSVELGYFLGTTANPANFTLLASTIQAVGTTPQAINGTGPVVAGYIQGGGVTIPGYVSGPVSFEILAWIATGNGALGGTYATSGYNGSYVWTEPSIAPNPSPAGAFGNMTGNAVLTAVPEPTTLALAGLGGLASLVMLRRKQA
jgi:PEP-CTERM motif